MGTLGVSCSFMALTTRGHFSGFESKQRFSGMVWCFACGVRSVVRVWSSSVV